MKRTRGSVDHLALKFQDSRNKSGGDGRAVPHRWSHLVETNVMPLPVEDPHLLDSSVTVSKAVSVEFQTFNSHQRTGSLNLAGTDIRHCSPAWIMNPQRASMLWQFANGSFLHLTSWNPFTHPGQMYPWVIINPIYGQESSAAHKRQDTLTHLSIRGIGDRTIGPSTRELATIPGTNRLPGDTT